MLTVHEALQMPVFATARIAAGHAGLNNQIRWVHIVDIPEAHYEWGRPGVLLLTAGFGLREPEKQAALIPKLVKEGFAGMVLSIGYYFEQLPERIRQAADELNFPVIETPRDVLFIDITEAIFEQIVNRQYVVLQKSGRIHEQLTNLVLRGGNLNDLAETLSGLLERSITIEDPSFRVLANAQRGPVDEARIRSIAHGRTTPELAQRLLEAGIYDQLLQGMSPVRVSPMADLEMTLERIVAPIIVDREIYGYIWIIAGEHPLTELDELATGHGATVAALIMFKEQAVLEAEEALRDDFFEQLLQGAVRSTRLTEQARQLNYRLNQPHQVLLIHSAPEAGGNARPLTDSVRQWLDKRRDPALIVWREEGLVLVVESEPSPTAPAAGEPPNSSSRGKELAAGLVKSISHPVRRLLIGVGNVFVGNSNESGGIRRSYEEAQEALCVGLALGSREGVVAFNDLGLLHWLYHLPAEARRGNVYLQYVQTLANYDAARNTQLLKTLEAYLDRGGSLIETAEALFVHRNTLLHRISRIETLCGVDLRNPLHRLNLHAAIKGYHLHNQD